MSIFFNKIICPVLILLLFFIIGIGPINAIKISAAFDGDLVQVGNRGSVYLIEGNLKRKLANDSILSHLCWSGIKQISSAELNSHPTGPNFTRVFQNNGHVYVLQDCQKRHVLSIDALKWNGFSVNDIRNINTNTFEHWSYGADLSNPKLMRSPGSSTIYFLDSGIRRAIKNEDTKVHWRISDNDVVVNKDILKYPQGSDLTRLVLFNNNVWGVDCGTFRYVGDENHMRLNGYDPKDLVAIGNDAANYLSIGDRLGIPRAVEDRSTGIKYLVDDNELRKFYSNYAFDQWGLNSGDLTYVSFLPGLSSVSTLNAVARGADGRYWYARYGERRYIPDQETFNDYGIIANDASAVSNSFLNWVRQGSDLDRGVESYLGNQIPATSGKTAREQHLYLSKTEADLGQTEASATIHYSASGTPSASRNGMAGGYGAFGSEASPASIDEERYYINMRWVYAEWYEDCSSMNNGHCTTRTRNVDITNKGWHRHKKILVKNPANGRRIVVSIEESGPAIWTDRVSGLSPEAMAALDASTNDTLEYRWAVNQNLPLGRLY